MGRQCLTIVEIVVRIENVTYQEMLAASRLQFLIEETFWFHNLTTFYRIERVAQSFITFLRRVAMMIIWTTELKILFTRKLNEFHKRNANLCDTEYKRQEKNTRNTGFDVGFRRNPIKTIDK